MTSVSDPPAPTLDDLSARLDDLSARLDDLLPEIRARAAEAERACTLPADVARALEGVGVFRLQRVRALGGLEADPVVILDVIERLAHADASTAWATLIGMTASSFYSAEADRTVGCHRLEPAGPTG
ncbi:acyl-CoA dehydrogenase family protein [Actinomycetospora sp. NBRC 106378]|uniref:acyl-CoA dehydrogenase family protein n=1 Tax=Actinomycetospora sp. NBRC 106378 TaxID=3032208 RepID=UPI0025548798|nr:acyl-CoA dehydrogenase family protein [Actinomycetospora sp. NBRC 106378]